MSFNVLIAAAQSPSCADDIGLCRPDLREVPVKLNEKNMNNINFLRASISELIVGKRGKYYRKTESDYILSKSYNFLPNQSAKAILSLRKIQSSIDGLTLSLAMKSFDTLIS